VTLRERSSGLHSHTRVNATWPRGHAVLQGSPTESGTVSGSRAAALAGTYYISLRAWLDRSMRITPCARWRSDKSTVVLPPWISRVRVCGRITALHTEIHWATRLSDDQYLKLIHGDSDWSSEIVNRESQINDARLRDVFEKRPSIRSSSVPISESKAEACSLNSEGCYFISTMTMTTRRRFKSTNQQASAPNSEYWIRLNRTEYNLSRVQDIYVDPVLFMQKNFQSQQRSRFRMSARVCTYRTTR